MSGADDGENVPPAARSFFSVGRGGPSSCSCPTNRTHHRGYHRRMLLLPCRDQGTAVMMIALLLLSSASSCSSASASSSPRGSSSSSAAAASGGGWLRSDSPSRRVMMTTMTTPMAFLSAECGAKRRRRRRRIIPSSSASSSSCVVDVLMGLRCGGGGDTNDDEEEEEANVDYSDDDGGGEVTKNNVDADADADAHDGSSSSQEPAPLVDVSVVETSEDPPSASTIAIDDGGGADYGSEEPGMDVASPPAREDDDEEEDGDDENENSDSDAMMEPVGGIIDGGDDEYDAGSEEEEEEEEDPSTAGGGGEDAVDLEGGDETASDDADEVSEESSDDSPVATARHRDDVSDAESSSPASERRSRLLSLASDRRAEGKSRHDSGDLADAANAFRGAASLLDEALLEEEEERGGGGGTEAKNSVALERATCRLHEALCLLKDGRPGECVEACSDVLGDGVTVVPLEDEDEGGDNDAERKGGASKPAAVVKIVPPPPSLRSSYVPPQIRARAHHRRAKARLALGDTDGALEDARSAAFMGDRNAVQLYGRLMREGSGGGGSTSDTSAFGGGGGLMGAGASSSSPFASLLDGGVGGGSSNPMLDGILQGMGGGRSGNPLMPTSGDFSSSLLSSLLTSGDGDGNGSGGNPLGLLGDLLAPPRQPSDDGGMKSRRRKKKKGGGGGGGGMDGLAKSLLSTLVKRIEDEGTQRQICDYLHSANTQQVMQFAAMAGVPMKEESARRLVGLAGGVTPRGISKSVSRVKRGISVVKTARKVLRVVDKYKAFIVLAVLCYWIRSAILEPYNPIGKKQARKLAQKAALSLLIMPSPSRHQRWTLGNLCGCIARAASSSSLFLSGDEGAAEGEDSSTSKTGIEEEMENLQNQLTFIEALEERNKAQLDSFVDEQDQWDSLEEEERILLSSKDSVIQKMEDLAEQLVMLFMGQKMRNG